MPLSEFHWMRKYATFTACSLFVIQSATAQRIPPLRLPTATPKDAARPNESTAEQTQVTFVEGQITDSIGLGLEGVAVAAYRRMPDGGRGQLLGKTETNKFGDFKITNAASIKEKALVVFNKARFAELNREVELGGDEVPFLGETLQGQLELTGTIISAADEHPLPHAAIEIRTPAREWTEHANDAGEFRVKGLSPGPAELVVNIDGFGREVRRIAKVEDAEPQRISMKPQRTVRIVIQDDIGKPVDGVLVEALDGPRNDMRSAISDSKGVVEFEGLHFDAASLRVRLSREHHVSDIDFVRSVSFSNEKLESETVLKLERAGRITGRIASEKNGDPVYGARVTVGDEIGDDSPHEWTNTEGRFEIDGVKPGPATVTVHAAGFAPQLGTAEVRAGQSTTIDLTVHRGRTIKGTVKGDDGAAVPVAIIQSETWRGKRSLRLGTVAGNSGDFEIEDAPLDDFTLHIVAPGYEDATVTVRPEETSVRFSLKKLDVAAGVNPFAAGSLKVGEEAPDLTLRDLRGGVLNLRAQKGKIVVIDFWATWCAPCVASLPELAKAHSRFKSHDDFVMIGVSRDFETDTAKSFLDAHPEYAWRQVVGAEGGVPEAVEKFHVKFIPALFIIGVDGKVAASYLDAADLTAELEKLVNKGSNSPN
ncbi:MAG: carboxypeptidase regulatory-like domain-containing protein [Planctomycetes bacterium]|nr:carboxypeptidase regulatory-like domain-containing protein [Planctomycetota bacterium]MBI3834075.1 carboxypeptidase regulatory-like domain-containing protein [Planctomycetota bacterium]